MDLTDAIALSCTCEYDVVTDWSYALAGFLVSTLFGVSPGQSFTWFFVRSIMKCVSGTSRAGLEYEYADVRNSYNMGTRDCMVYIALKPEGVSPEG